MSGCGHLRWCWSCLLLPAVWSVALDLKGPDFVQEPPHRVEFSNISGGRVDCSAHGSPPPQLTWSLGDGTPLVQIPDLPLVHPNVSLVFPPFPAEHNRHDIRTALYRCKAQNQVGHIVSRDVHVRAVVKQKYEVQVYDEYIVSGNTAVLRCQVPSYVADYVMVTPWIQDGSVNIHPSTDTGGKYAVLTSGDIYIYNAGPSDGYKTYACSTVHRLTGEVHASAYPGPIIITAPLSAHVQPQTQVSDAGKEVVLQCITGGHPLTRVSWYRNAKPIVRDNRFDNHCRKRTMGCISEWEMVQATAELQLGDASPELLYWFTEQTLQPGPTVSLKWQPATTESMDLRRFSCTGQY